MYWNWINDVYTYDDACKKIDELHSDILKLQSQLAIAEKALEFYANPHSWTNGDNGTHKYIVMPNDFESDGIAGIVAGKRAREALAELLRMRGEKA